MTNKINAISAMFICIVSIRKKKKKNALSLIFWVKLGPNYGRSAKGKKGKKKRKRTTTTTFKVSFYVEYLCIF